MRAAEPSPEVLNKITNLNKKAVAAYQNRTVEKLRALPGVSGAALAGQIPFGADYDCRGFHAAGRMKPNPVDDPCVERYGITPDYLRVMSIALLAGRGFTEKDTAAATPVILVSQSAARAVWHGDNPLGSKVRFGNPTEGPWSMVVGIVADVHHDDLAAPVVPAFYTAEAQVTDSYLVAVLNAATSDADGRLIRD